MSNRRIVVDGQPVAYDDGDSVATAILRGGGNSGGVGFGCLDGKDVVGCDT